MEGLEATARTVEEAIEKAALQLGVDQEDVEVVTVEKVRSGLLGLGGEQFKVTVAVRAADVVDMAKETLEELLRVMGVSATVALPEIARGRPAEGEVINPSFEIEGEDAGLLIGRKGETLSDLQYLVNFILSRKAHRRVNVDIDIEHYRERRDESLRAMANRLAERVASTGRSFTVEPMPARERRIIHMTLSNNSKVTTESAGEGIGRQITIIPKRGGRGQGPPGPRNRPH